MSDLWYLLWKVLPLFAPDYTADRSGGDIELRCKLRLIRRTRVEKMTDFGNLLGGKFRTGMRLTQKAYGCMPTLCNHISRVVGGCTEKQMRGIAAPGIVALMADPHALWNRAVMQFPRQPMGVYIVTSAPTDDQSSVTHIGEQAAPYPAAAFVALVNLVPESLLEGLVGIVPVNEAPVLVRAIRSGQWLSAAALAQFCGDKFQLQLLWGMILHGISSFVASVRAGAVSAAPGFPIGATGVIVAQNGSTN